MSAVVQEGAARPAVARLQPRPLPYLVSIAASMLAAFAFQVRTEGIFACPADGYGPTRYLAYCQAEGYGEYDRGAFWYGLQPALRSSLEQADVLFLGNSRMQFAFSTPATSAWFAGAQRRFFLLGFTHTEDLQFVRPLLDRVPSSPKAYVINVDRFFDDRLTAPTQAILRDGETAARYRQKHFWQPVHRALCTALPALCGTELAFYRDISDGTWILHGSAGMTASGVSDAVAEEQERWPRYAALAADFIATLPVMRRCIILTIAPYQGTKRAEAEAIAGALGLDLLAPHVEGLRTFDGSHLDPPSAQLWSRKFFAVAGPRLRSCLERPATVDEAVTP